MHPGERQPAIVRSGGRWISFSKYCDRHMRRRGCMVRSGDLRKARFAYLDRGPRSQGIVRHAATCCGQSVHFQCSQHPESQTLRESAQATRRGRHGRYRWRILPPRRLEEAYRHAPHVPRSRRSSPGVQLAGLTGGWVSGGPNAVLAPAREPTVGGRLTRRRIRIADRLPPVRSIP